MQIAPPSALEKLAFLAGHWRGEQGDIVIEEMWLAPQAGVAQGTVRLVEGGSKIGTIELIVIAAEADHVVMRYNHFHPDYRTWENDGPIELTLTEAHDGEVMFRNLQSPMRHASEMGYCARGSDTMTSWVVPLDEAGVAQPRFSMEFRRVA